MMMMMIDVIYVLIHVPKKLGKPFSPTKKLCPEEDANKHELTKVKKSTGLGRNWSILGGGYSYPPYNWQFAWLVVGL